MNTFPADPSAAPLPTSAPQVDPIEADQLDTVDPTAREKMGKRSVWRSRLVLCAKLVVAASLLSWLLLSGQLDLRLLASIPLSGELGVLVALTLGAMGLPALRWWWLLRIQQLREPLGKITALTWTGYFAALVLPGAASGDLAKSYLILRRRPKGRARAFSTILADRFAGVHSLLLLGSLSILWLAGHAEMKPAIQAMAGGTLVLLLGATLAAGLLLFTPSRKLLLRILPGPWRTAWNESFELYRNRKGALLGCYCLSLASSAMTVACFAVAAGLLGDVVGLNTVFLAGPLVVLANCLPLSPGGIGVAETASSGLFASFGVLSGAEMMVLIRVCMAMLALPGVAAAMMPSRRPKSPP